jgi:hypothetical protein
MSFSDESTWLVATRTPTFSLVRGVSLVGVPLNYLPLVDGEDR